MGLKAVVAALVVLGLTSPVEPAGAAPGATWTIASTPNVRVPNGTLAATSCPETDSCVAVGSYVDRAGLTVTLVENWNGARWAMQPSPDPRGASSSDLDAVSCVSPQSCMAVGASSSGTLAELWNGTRWSDVATPLPEGVTRAFLEAVSCTSPNSCTAVGYSVTAADAYSPLAEVWNGRSWVVQRVPGQPGAARQFLYGLSCSARGTCTAVGAWEDSYGLVFTLAEERRGATWAVKTTPEVKDSTESFLFAVSCTAGDSCLATGLAQAPNPEPLSETWNGLKWTIRSVPVPSGSSSSGFSSVSCTAAHSCTAVGTYTASSQQVSLAERWNGRAWAQETVPEPPGTPALAGVSCAESDSCVAVGYTVGGFGSTQDSILVDGWDGTAWSHEGLSDPIGNTGSQLAAVSCAGGATCVAAGSSAVGALAESSVRGTWALQDARNPSGATVAQLDAVSCGAPDSCTAVGFFSTSIRQSALAELWNGRAWRVERTPSPTGTYFNGVSCPSRQWCIAVGGSGSGTLAELWDGSTWRILPAPKIHDSLGADLFGVSCASEDSCEAVGADDRGTGEVTLAEVWNGTTWTVQTTPTPSGATGVDLFGVSCAGAAFCEAAGSYDMSSGTTAPLAETWDGRGWSIQTTPDHKASVDTAFAGISCASASSCTAVGTSLVGGGVPVTFAERWDGSAWRIQQTPNPPGAFGSFLVGVSCTRGGGGCVAVGYHKNAAGVPLTLAESEPQTG